MYKLNAKYSIWKHFGHLNILLRLSKNIIYIYFGELRDKRIHKKSVTMNITISSARWVPTLSHLCNWLKLVFNKYGWNVDSQIANSKSYICMDGTQHLTDVRCINLVTVNYVHGGLLRHRTSLSWTNSPTMRFAHGDELMNEYMSKNSDIWFLSLRECFQMKFIYGCFQFLKYFFIIFLHFLFAFLSYL